MGDKLRRQKKRSEIEIRRKTKGKEKKESGTVIGKEGKYGTFKREEEERKQTGTTKRWHKTDYSSSSTPNGTPTHTETHRPASLCHNHLRAQLVELVPQRLHLQRGPRVQQLGVHRQGAFPLVRRGVLRALRRHANVFCPASRCLSARIIPALVAGALQARCTHRHNDAASATQV